MYDRVARSLALLALVGCACAVNKDDGASTDDVMGADTGGASGECGAAGTNSHISDGQCLCDDGYVWAEPNDPNDFTCVPGGGGGGCDGPHNVLMGDTCYCEAGYDWCTPDPADFSCCATGTGSETGGPGTSGATSAVDDTGCDIAGADPPESCTPDQEGFVFCSNTARMGPDGSKYYTCQGGTFVEWTKEMLDQSCMRIGYDYAIGCIDDGTMAQIQCGNGVDPTCGGTG